MAGLALSYTSLQVSTEVQAILYASTIPPLKQSPRIVHKEYRVCQRWVTDPPKHQFPEHGENSGAIRSSQAQRRRLAKLAASPKNVCRIDNTGNAHI